MQINKVTLNTFRGNKDNNNESSNILPPYAFAIGLTSLGLNGGDTFENTSARYPIWSPSPHTISNPYENPCIPIAQNHELKDNTEFTQNKFSKWLNEVFSFKNIKKMK